MPGMHNASGNITRDCSASLLARQKDKLCPSKSWHVYHPPPKCFEEARNRKSYDAIAFRTILISITNKNKEEAETHEVMWEQIRSNQRRSVLLVIGMGALLIIIGYLLGFFFGRVVEGLLIAFVLWVTFFLISVGSILIVS